MQNEAQYDLDRKAAKIFVFSSKNLDKYEYLTGEDLDLKPSTIEQAKLEYSPLGKIFIKKLNEDDKKEGLLQILKNIENNIKDENKKELESIKNENSQKYLKMNQLWLTKSLKKNVQLKDKLDHIFKSFDSNFNSTGKKMSYKAC